MAQFINSKEGILQEALDGMVAASGGRLVSLDGYPFIRVIAPVRLGPVPRGGDFRRRVRA